LIIINFTPDHSLPLREITPSFKKLKQSGVKKRDRAASDINKKLIKSVM
jgi:hypothetical protein